MGGGKKYIRGRLLVDDRLAGDHGIPLRRRQADLVEVRVDLDLVRARSHGGEEAGCAAASHQLDGTGERLQALGNQLQVDLVSAVLGGREVQRDAVLLGDAADISVLPGANERQEVFGCHRDTTLAEERHRSGVDERLGVGEHSVHVENDSANRHGLRLAVLAD